MPFDNTKTEMTRIEKLRRLDEILKNMKPGQQGDFATCLWPRVMEDAALLMAGLPQPKKDEHYPYPYGFPQQNKETLAVCAFFGLPAESILWSWQSAGVKRKAIAKMIAKEKEKANAV